MGHYSTMNALESNFSFGDGPSTPRISLLPSYRIYTHEQQQSLLQYMFSSSISINSSSNNNSSSTPVRQSQSQQSQPQQSQQQYFNSSRRSMPSILHHHLRKIALALIVVIGISLFKLRYLADPADVDSKDDAIMKDPVGARIGSATATATATADGAIIRTPNRNTPAPTPMPSKKDKKKKKGNNKPTRRPTTPKPSTTKRVPTPAPTTSSSSSSSAKPTRKPTRRPTAKPIESSKNDNDNNNKPKEETNTNSTISNNKSAALTQTTIKYKMNSTMAGTNFVDTYCALESAAEWYPTTNDTAWQQRAPYVLLAGALEAGVPSLTRRLLQHSQLQENHHPGFFLPKHYRYFLQKKNGRPKIWSARNHLYSTNTKEVKRNAQLYRLESAANGGYLFYATHVPKPLFCTCPWTKLIIVLRNPIDRIAAQYQSATALGLKVPFETWIETDLEMLAEAGITGTATTADEQSWSKYLTVARGNGPVGRGLYAIQLQYWIDTMGQMSDTKIKDDLLILHYDDWKQRPEAVWTKVLDFLKLPSNTNSIALPPPIAEPVSPPMDANLRKKLKKYFGPHNQQLYDLVGWNTKNNRVVWE